MKLHSILLIGALLVPSLATAQVESALSLNGSFTAGADSVFEAKMNGYQISNSVAVLAVADASINDIKEARFLDKSGWVLLTPYQSGSDVLAKFISDTGFDVNGQRVITLRINFNTPKTYVIGFSLLDSEGRTISSAAAPITVNGPSVLGQSTTYGGSVFTRSLSYGSRGADVSALQERLTREGVYSGPVTGFFGNLTQAAVKKYQAAHGIPAIGVVGPQTRASLNQ